MLIPGEISETTVKGCRVLNNIFIKNRKIKADNIFWDDNNVKTLRNLCMLSIKNNWKGKNLYKSVITMCL